MELITVLSILLIFTTVATVGCAIALKRAINRIDYFEKWTEEFMQRIFTAQLELKRIDASGHFEADDEVGYFFKSLQEIMERLFEMGVIDEDEIKEQLEAEFEKNKTAKEIDDLNETIKKSKRQTGARAVGKITNR